jgi:hypothetical protein
MRRRAEPKTLSLGEFMAFTIIIACRRQLVHQPIVHGDGQHRPGIGDGKLRPDPRRGLTPSRVMTSPRDTLETVGVRLRINPKHAAGTVSQFDAVAV